MTKLDKLSVIIPIVERHGSIPELWTEYDAAVRQMAEQIEYVFVVDGGFEQAARDVATLSARDDRVKAVQLTRSFGESTALTIAKQHISAPAVLTLPSYSQVQPSDLPRLLQQFADSDMVIARRWPRRDSRLNRLSNFVFNRIMQFMTGLPFRDLGCGVRLMRRSVFDEIQVYADQHRFLPILGHQLGFRVREADLRQADQDKHLRVYRPGVYLRRGLDLLAIFFLVKFTKKPLRFFGLIGSTLIAAGALILLVIAFQKLILSVALADRPLLLLGLLFVVLGVQLFAVGLLGELMIFVHAGELKEYAVLETVNFSKASDEVSSAKTRDSETESGGAAGARSSATSGIPVGDQARR